MHGLEQEKWKLHAENVCVCVRCPSVGWWWPNVWARYKNTNKKDIIIYQQSVWCILFEECIVYGSHKCHICDAYGQEVANRRYSHPIYSGVDVHDTDAHRTLCTHQKKIKIMIIMNAAAAAAATPPPPPPPIATTSTVPHSGHLGHIKMQWCPGLQRARESSSISYQWSRMHRHTFLTLSCKFIVTVRGADVFACLRHINYMCDVMRCVCVCMCEWVWVFV